MPVDSLGQVLSLQHESSAQAVSNFGLGFLGYDPRILEVMAAAEHDESTIVQACAAALWMFSESPAGRPKARAHLDRAVRSKLPCTEREQQFAAAISHWVNGDLRSAMADHEALAHSHPRDLVSVKLGQYHAFNLGDSPTMLRLALLARPAAADVAALHGMLAFAWEQCHRLDQAEAAARHALAMKPDEPWAQHALAHVMLTDGRLREGLAFMEAVSGGWSGLTSFMRTHNWWHLALFHLELGDDAAAVRLYDREVWGVDKSYSQDQVGAVSLLARLELGGVAVGERWDELAEHLKARVADQVQPFLDMQYLYGLARAGRPEAATMMANVERHAAQAPLSVRDAWQKVAVPACRAMVAHGHGRWAEAADQLALALPRLVAIGGSHAQRDLFEQMYIDSMQRCGQLAGAVNLLQPQFNAHPQSERLRRRLHDVYGGLRLPGLAHH